MAFSLKNLVRGIKDDLNPIDGGKSHGNPQGKPAPQPASTAQAQQQSQQPAGTQQLQVQAVRKPQFIPEQITPVQAPAPLQVQTVAPKPLQVGTALIPQNPEARTAPTGAIKQAQQQVEQAKAKINVQDPLSKGAQYIGREFVARPVAQVAASVQDLNGQANASYTPGSQLEKQIFGAEPINSIQKGAADRYLKYNDKNHTQALAAALGGGLVDVANDAPIVGTALKGGSKAVTQGAKALDDLAVAQVQLKPATEIGAVGKDVNKAVEAARSPLSTKQLPIVGDPIKNSGFASGAQRSAEVSDPTKRILKQNQPTYTVRNTQKLANDAEDFTKDPKTLKKATADVHDNLSVPEGQIDDQTVAKAIAVAKAHDATGDHDLASGIYEGLSGHLTKQGQSIQAASLLSNRTPEGLKFQAIKSLKKGGVKVTPELQKKLDDAYSVVKSTKQGSDERFRASQVYAKLVADSLPATAADKATAFWKAGLLTGIKTQTGNLLSNTTFGALHNLSNPLAVGIDKVLSVGTGQRTKALTGKGLAQGFGEGFVKGKDVLKSGIDERPGLINKYDQSSGLTFGNQHGEVQFGDSLAGKAATKYVNGVFRLMGAADRPAYYAQLRNSLADLGKVYGINKGLKGDALTAHVDDFVKNPPSKQFQLATDEAEKSVLANDTLLSDIANKVRGAADKVDNPAGRGAAKLAVNVIAPFTKVPSAFISRVFDYTPVGAIKEVVGQAAKHQLDQRALSTAISEATTGTSLVYLGAELANNGLLSGNYPDDPKEQARWKAQGIQPNAVNVGGKWLSMNYFGPLGALLSQGKRAHDTISQGGNATDVATGFTGGAVQDALGQSFLQGVSGSLDAINDPKRYADTYATNLTGSVVPTLSKDIAEATDSKQRDVDNAVGAVATRIPGVREKLAAKQDVYGNDLARKTNPLGTLVDPFRTSNAITNDVKSEVARLHGVDENNKDLQVTPTPIDKTISVEGKKIKLSPDQRRGLQKEVGQETQKAWGELIKTDEYQSKDDAGKAKALEDLRKDTAAAYQRKYVVDNHLGEYNKTASKAAQKILNDEQDVSKYADGKQNSSKSDYNSSPDAEYKDLQAKYDQDKKDGKISDVQDIKRSKELTRAKIGSAFDKKVRDLYSLSKADINAYVNAHPEQADLANQLIAYDNALKNGGQTAYLKFKTGIAPSSKKGGFGRKTAKGSKKKGGSKKSSGGSYDYAKGLESINKLASGNQSALRNLVNKDRVKSRKAKIA